MADSWGIGFQRTKARREGRVIVFVDESGISERPARARAWAPKGCTPVIQFHFHFNWNHVSVIAGLTRTNCLFRLHRRSIKKEEVVEFLKALKSHLKQPLLVIRNGPRAHRSKLVREYLDGLHASARDKLKSAQKRPSIIAACWMQATLW